MYQLKIQIRMMKSKVLIDFFTILYSSNSSILFHFTLIDIDASSDDSDFLLLAPWFDEKTYANNNNNDDATISNTEIPSDSTQILDTTFELDSNHSYTRVNREKINA